MMNTPNHSMPLPAILIIENEVSNRILVERVLSTRGYRCIPPLMDVKHYRYSNMNMLILSLLTSPCQSWTAIVPHN